VPLLQWKTRESGPVTLLDQGLAWIGRSIVGLVTTTLVASLATAPFAAYHFQAMNPYGLVGNALALPLVSLVVMPCAVLGVLAFPFGLDGPVWRVMGFAVTTVLEVSTWVGGFSGSTVIVPALGLGALGLMSAGLLVLTLPASALRWLAVLPVGAGMAIAASPKRFDVYIDRNGSGAAIRSAGGRLALVGRPSAFVVEQWLRADGDGRNADDESLRRDARCDKAGCVVEGADNRNVAFVKEMAAFEEDCRRAAIVITRLDAPSQCGAVLVLDREAFAARGATALRLARETIEMHSVRKGVETRPWSGPVAEKAQTQNGPRHARPVPEQDFPEEEISSGEPD
jgi:competence protein ComEC